MGRESVYIPDGWDYFDKLRALAKKTDRSFSYLVRKSVQEYVDKNDDQLQLKLK